MNAVSLRKCFDLENGSLETSQVDHVLMSLLFEMDWEWFHLLLYLYARKLIDFEELLKMSRGFFYMIDWKQIRPMDSKDPLKESSY